MNEIQMVLGSAAAGSTGKFMAKATDGELYWITQPESGSDAAVIEFIVGSLGALIGAPVVEVSLLEIPLMLEGATWAGGVELKQGLVLGAKDVPSAVELRPALTRRERDDNARRHVGAIALFDWCLGADPQWLYRTDSESSTYSHDHGHYLNGPVLDASVLRSALKHDRMAEVSSAPGDLSTSEIEVVASRLRAVERSQIVDIVSDVPLAWGVESSILAEIVDVVDDRRSAVADRLDLLVW